MRKYTWFATAVAGTGVCLVVLAMATLWAYRIREEPHDPPLEKPVVYPPFEVSPGYVFTKEEYQRCEFWGPPRDCMGHVTQRVVGNLHIYQYPNGKTVTEARMEFAPACSVVWHDKPAHNGGDFGSDGNPSGVIFEALDAHVTKCLQYPWVTRDLPPKD